MHAETIREAPGCRRHIFHKLGSRRDMPFVEAIGWDLFQSTRSIGDIEMNQIKSRFIVLYHVISRPSVSSSSAGIQVQQRMILCCTPPKRPQLARSRIVPRFFPASIEPQSATKTRTHTLQQQARHSVPAGPYMIKQRQALGLGAAEENNLRMGYYQQSPSRVSAGAEQLPPPYFCEQTSASTCRTFSPSPQVSATPSGRHSSNSLLPPDFAAADQVAEQEEEEEEGRRRRHSEVAISSDGGSSIRSSRSRLPSTPKTEKPQRVRRVLWNEFDAPAQEGAATDGRALARRNHTFKIFVIFRGGWCTSSHALLQGGWCLERRCVLLSGR